MFMSNRVKMLEAKINDLQTELLLTQVDLCRARDTISLFSSGDCDLSFKDDLKALLIRYNSKNMRVYSMFVDWGKNKINGIDIRYT